MADVNLKTRVKQKSDTSANWAKATNFVPLKGEIIIYNDVNKIKIGDGVTKVNDLGFSKTSISDVNGLSDELNKKFDKTGGTISGATTIEVKTDKGSLLTLHRVGIDSDAGESTFTIDSYGADGGTRNVGFNANDAFFYYKRNGKTIAFPQTEKTGSMYDDQLLLQSVALSNFAKRSHTHSISDIANLQTILDTCIKGSVTNSTASKATAGTARSIGNANVGVAVKVLTGASGTFLNSASMATTGVYDESTQTLTLQLTTGSANVSTSSSNITPAAASSDKITPYSFADVSVSKIN